MNDVPAGAGEALDRLADLAGILPAYSDTRGEQHVTSAETKRALLGAMGIAAPAQTGRLLHATPTDAGAFRAEEETLAPWSARWYLSEAA